MGRKRKEKPSVESLHSTISRMLVTESPVSAINPGMNYPEASFEEFF